MKALSLYQPWASLVAIGAKQYETRSWPTSYRGPLAIHAAKHWTDEERASASLRLFREPLEAAGLDPLALPLGCVLCVVDLVDVLPTERAVQQISLVEFAFGNYTRGRWAWKLENVRPLKVPVPAIGRQGLWTWEAA